MRSGPDAPRIDCHAGLSDLPPHFFLLFGETLFDSAAWYSAVCTAGLPPTAEALFVSVSAGGHPLALFPMRRDVTRISSLTTPYTCLWRPLTAPGLTAAQLHGAGRAFGRWCRSWATVRLDALDLEDPAWSILLAGLRDAGINPLPFDHFGNWSAFTGLGWDAYLADRPGQIRESLRRRGKQLLADGATFRVVTDGRDLEPAIAQYEAVYAASWKQPEPFPQFNAALMRASAAEGWLRLGLLEMNGKTLAAQIWIMQGGRATVLKLAHDEAFNSASPGTVLTGWMIRHLLECDEAAVLDFGRGDDEYKQSWTSLRRQRQGLVLANPWRPFGLGAVIVRRLKKMRTG